MPGPGVLSPRFRARRRAAIDRQAAVRAWWRGLIEVIARSQSGCHSARMAHDPKQQTRDLIERFTAAGRSRRTGRTPRPPLAAHAVERGLLFALRRAMNDRRQSRRSRSVTQTMIELRRESKRLRPTDGPKVHDIDRSPACRWRGRKQPSCAMTQPVRSRHDSRPATRPIDFVTVRRGQAGRPWRPLVAAIWPMSNHRGRSVLVGDALRLHDRAD